MQKILHIIQRKPAIFIIIGLVYLIGVGFLKWRLAPSTATLLYLTGGVIGMYFLDVAETFFNITPSPFRSVVFMALFSLVSFFVVTSAGSVFASGLVLSLYLTLLLWQIGEWKMLGHLTSWYTMVAVPVDRVTQRWILLVFFVLFFAETYFFIR